MKITKVKDSFDEYRAEVSWSELNAIIAALDSCGTGAVSDELSAGFNWYLDKLPKPGEDEKEKKEEEKAESDALKGGEVEDEVLELPAAPGGVEKFDFDSYHDGKEEVGAGVVAPVEAGKAGEPAELSIDDELPAVPGP